MWARLCVLYVYRYIKPSNTGLLLLFRTKNVDFFFKL